MERFSLECFDCGKSSDRVCKYAGTGKCPGDVKKSFEHIFDLIGDENFVWPLHLDRDGNLEFNRTEQDMNDAGQ